MARVKTAFWLCLLTTALTYLLICWGGIVHNTGSSLACPDWPTCFGQLIPDTSYMSEEEQRGIFWEHGHRTIGALLGLASIAICALLWPGHSRGGSLRRGGATLLGLVIIQGLLGGITVMLELDATISTIHLGLSMILLILLIYLTRETWLRARPAALAPWPAPAAQTVLWLAIITLIALYAQLILGAAVRHTGATWAAGIGPAAAIFGKDPTTGNYVLLSSNVFASLNLIHRYVGVAVTMLITVCCATVWSKLGGASTDGRKFLIWLPLIAVLAQILVGIGMISLHFNVFMRTLHLGFAALVLVCQFVLVMELRRAANQSGEAIQTFTSDAPLTIPQIGG